MEQSDGRQSISRFEATVRRMALPRERNLVMKNLFEPAAVEELRQRMANLQPDSQPLWGKMNPAQALAHCSAGMQMAMGEIRPRRILMGRLFGRLAKKSMIVNEKPMPRNVKTDKSLLMEDERDLVVERQRLRGLIGSFAAGGPAVCTNHPHFFFGPLTPAEWSALMYQHMDHHLRQFQV
ncbi:MAG: DUF1569 domain-containing protein [Terracidiphilus sp.]